MLISLKKHTRENNKNKASYKPPIKIIPQNSNQDLTPMRKSTIELIEFFKEYDAKNKSIENEGIFPSGIVSLPIHSKSLTRYETFFNYILEHNNNGYVPSNKNIYENLKFEGKKFTEFILLKEKQKGQDLGDISLEGKKYKIIRKTKY
ncbi:MAG: hypothetical protein ABF289_09250 [Clostridiales bacterium]